MRAYCEVMNRKSRVNVDERNSCVAFEVVAVVK